MLRQRREKISTLLVVAQPPSPQDDMSRPSVLVSALPADSRPPPPTLATLHHACRSTVAVKVSTSVGVNDAASGRGVGALTPSILTGIFTTLEPSGANLEVSGPSGERQSSLQSPTPHEPATPMHLARPNAPGCRGLEKRTNPPSPAAAAASVALQRCVAIRISKSHWDGDSHQRCQKVKRFHHLLSAANHPS